MKKNFIFLLILLISLSACSKKDTLNLDNSSSPIVAQSERSQIPVNVDVNADFLDNEFNQLYPIGSNLYDKQDIPIILDITAKLIIKLKEPFEVKTDNNGLDVQFAVDAIAELHYYQEIGGIVLIDQKQTVTLPSDVVTRVLVDVDENWNLDASIVDNSLDFNPWNVSVFGFNINLSNILEAGLSFYLQNELAPTIETVLENKINLKALATKYWDQLNYGFKILEDPSELWLTVAPGARFDLGEITTNDLENEINLPIELSAKPRIHSDRNDRQNIGDLPQLERDYIGLSEIELTFPFLFSTASINDFIVSKFKPLQTTILGRDYSVKTINIEEVSSNYTIASAEAKFGNNDKNIEFIAQPFLQDDQRILAFEFLGYTEDSDNLPFRGNSDTLFFNKLKRKTAIDLGAELDKLVANWNLDINKVVFEDAVIRANISGYKIESISTSDNLVEARLKGEGTFALEVIPK
jgi:hypothetical protein